MMRSRLARRARGAAIAAGAVVLLAALAHTVLWWRATLLLEREAGRWIAARAAEGLEVRHGLPLQGGWPWAARMHLPDVTAAAMLPEQGPNAPPMILTIPAVALEVALLSPRMLHIDIATPIRLSGSILPAATAEARAFRIEVPLASGSVAEMRLVGRDLRIVAAGERAGAEVLELGAWRKSGAGSRSVLALDLAATGVELPEIAANPLGRRVARAVLDLQAVGDAPATGTLRARMLGWRNAGGVLQVARLQLDYGPLGLDADATIRLDADAQPSGEGRARVQGLGATLDALAAVGQIPRQAAQAGRTIVAFMQRTPAGGGAPVVELPLTLSNRTLSTGRFVLLQLPPIAWPP